MTMGCQMPMVKKVIAAMVMPVKYMNVSGVKVQLSG